MGRIQLTIGIICIAIISIIGMAIKLVTVGEGLILILLTLISSPFLFSQLKKTPKHNDR
jgi:hypothetical protein